MYVDPNFQTKKALKVAVMDKLRVGVFSPGPFPATMNGVEFIEGPHYPKLHSWYAKVEVKNGTVTKVY